MRKLQDTRPDVIFMDYMMPEMDGLEACQAIARNSATSAIPVIMTTSNDTPEFRKRGVASGARGFLSKGLEDRELDNVLDSVVRPGPEPQPKREPAMASTRAELDEQTLAMIRDQAINAARRASEEYFTGQLPGLEEQVIQVAEAAARKAVAGVSAGATPTAPGADADQLAALQRRVDNLYNDKQLRSAVQKMVREESGGSSGGSRSRRRTERSPSGFGRFVRNVVILGVLLVAAYLVVVIAFPGTPLAISLEGLVDGAIRRLTSGG